MRKDDGKMTSIVWAGVICSIENSWSSRCWCNSQINWDLNHEKHWVSWDLSVISLWPLRPWVGSFWPLQNGTFPALPRSGSVSVQALLPSGKSLGSDPASFCFWLIESSFQICQWLCSTSSCDPTTHPQTTHMNQPLIITNNYLTIGNTSSTMFILGFAGLSLFWCLKCCPYEFVANYWTPKWIKTGCVIIFGLNLPFRGIFHSQTNPYIRNCQLNPMKPHH